jgi:glycosyltransferase involved in cell wall biosynthesis
MYVEGPGDIVESFRRWNNKEDVLTETSRTYSGQFFDFCKNNNLQTLAISYHENADAEITPQFRIENIPKKILGKGPLYHFSQVLYGLRIMVIALKHRPKYLDITSGVTYWFVLSPLKLFGIKIVSHLHNCLWPVGYPPTRLVPRILIFLDSLFFRYIADITLCISPEVQRQVEEIAKPAHGRIYQFRARYTRKHFENPPKPMPHSQRPFNIVFAGRIERNKGVFDVLEMAEQLRSEGVTFEICGGGSALVELKQECKQRDLTKIVTIQGELKRPQLLEAYARAHVVIVPTRSDFDEGFAKVAAEAILLNRPAICSSTVPAVEVLKNAVVEVASEDIESYVNNIRRLLADAQYYDSLCQSCPLLREQFLGGSQGLTSVLEKCILFNPL